MSVENIQWMKIKLCHQHKEWIWITDSCMICHSYRLKTDGTAGFFCNAILIDCDNRYSVFCPCSQYKTIQESSLPHRYLWLVITHGWQFMNWLLRCLVLWIKSTIYPICCGEPLKPQFKLWLLIRFETFVFNEMFGNILFFLAVCFLEFPFIYVYMISRLPLLGHLLYLYVSCLHNTVSSDTN